MKNKIINNWTILKDDDKHSTSKHKRVICKCCCGTIKSVLLENLITGKSKSCGCKKYKYKNKNKRLYNIWKGIKVRCLCKTNNRYKYYGGRGIKICDEWKNDFISFQEWSINNGYKDNLTIDRIDVNGNYEPNNCRWVNNIIQSNNCRTNIYFTLNGNTQTLKQWCREYNIDYRMVYYRVTHGWTLKEALSIPCRERRVKK